MKFGMWHTPKIGHGRIESRRRRRLELGVLSAEQGIATGGVNGDTTYRPVDVATAALRLFFNSQYSVEIEVI